MKRICVFCGSSPGLRPDYVVAAEQLGRLLVKRNIGLVFGGGRVGLMGHIAQTVMAAGGEVIGVIPRALVDREVAFRELTDLRVVDSMHSRKALMAELADGFIALPGGLGTLEEFFEVLTWSQLGIHQKPCGLLNVENYFRGLLDFVNYMEQEQFVARACSSMILAARDPEELLLKFERYQPPRLDKAKLALDLSNA